MANPRYVSLLGAVSVARSIENQLAIMAMHFEEFDNAGNDSPKVEKICDNGSPREQGLLQNRSTWLTAFEQRGDSPNLIDF